MTQATQNVEPAAAKSVFLSPDERYDVWAVKLAERPYLMMDDDVASAKDHGAHGTTTSQSHQGQESDQDEKKEDCRADNSDADSDDESQASLPLPLMDGCDIPGWRRQAIVPLHHVGGPKSAVDAIATRKSQASSMLQAALRVGPGCTLLRRETQLPVLSQRNTQQWQQVRATFLQEPAIHRQATRILATEARGFDVNPWFERDNVPVVLEGLADDWKAMRTCKWDALVKRYGHCYWRFSDTHGVCMPLSTYDKYTKTLEGMTDDAPLAVYDSQLTDGHDSNRDETGVDRQSLWDDYETPRCFSIDRFECLDYLAHDGGEAIGSGGDNDDNPGNDENASIDDDDDDDDDDENASIDDDDDASTIDIHRPPYRWILMGPERSGTGLHVDPLGTHAWVTVVEGLKRWVLFPPTVDKAKIGMQDPQIPSAIWFHRWYAKVMDMYGDVAIEVVQRPGETVYVPAGWPHLVLNLDRTVALTENYATEYPTWRRLTDSVKKEEPQMFEVWMKEIQKRRPELFASGTFLSSA